MSLERTAELSRDGHSPDCSKRADTKRLQVLVSLWYYPVPCLQVHLVEARSQRGFHHTVRPLELVCSSRVPCGTGTIITGRDQYCRRSKFIEGDMAAPDPQDVEMEDATSVREGFYRVELAKTVWEVPTRYQDLSPIGTGAYGTVW